MDQVPAQSVALVTLKDAFLKNAIETVDRPCGLRETVLVFESGEPVEPAKTGTALGPTHNERPA